MRTVAETQEVDGEVDLDHVIGPDQLVIVGKESNAELGSSGGRGRGEQEAKGHKDQRKKWLHFQFPFHFWN